MATIFFPSFFYSLVLGPFNCSVVVSDLIPLSPSLTLSQPPSFKNLENVLVPHNVDWAMFILILS